MTSRSLNLGIWLPIWLKTQNLIFVLAFLYHLDKTSVLLTLSMTLTLVLDLKPGPWLLHVGTNEVLSSILLKNLAFSLKSLS